MAVLKSESWEFDHALIVGGTISSESPLFQPVSCLTRLPVRRVGQLSRRSPDDFLPRGSVSREFLIDDSSADVFLLYYDNRLTEGHAFSQ